MKFKHIIIYSKKLPPEFIGGIETNAYNLIKYLSEKTNLKIRVVSRIDQKHNSFSSTTKTIPFGSRSHKVTYIDKYDARETTRLLRRIKGLWMKPRETLIYHNTLDLHSHFPALKAAGYHQIARSGGNDIFFIGRSEYSRKSFHRNLHHLDKILLNSEYSRMRSSKAGLKEDLLAIIKGGCEMAPPGNIHETTISNKKPIIISCGRIVDFKGIEDAIEACALLKHRGIDFNYLIIGEGDLYSKIEKLIQSKKLTDSCILLGKRSPQETQHYYTSADIYLSTSKDIHKELNGESYIHTETMGRSICEAQINGVPVVATAAGGVPEMLVDGKTGVVVEQANVLQIANALQMLIEDIPLRKQFAQSAKHYASKEFEWNHVIRKTLDEFHAIEPR